MTLPSNGSRTLLVDGGSYRFMVTRREGAPRLNVTIEHERYPGRCLTAQVDVRRCDAIGTKEIEAFVRQGVLAGWAPAGTHTRNKPNIFKLDDKQTEEVLVQAGI